MNARALEASAADLATLNDAWARVFAPRIRGVLRRGRNLVFGEVEVLSAQGELAADAPCTCTLL